MDSITRNTAYKSLALSAALVVASPASAADEVQLIFSAENALYGSGYAVGRADGWIDDALRSAVRDYQNRTPGLSVSGVLDYPTLASLGVSAPENTKIRDNAVAQRRDALAQLGLPEAQPVAKTSPKPAPKPQPVVVAAPEPAPEPEPQPVTPPAAAVAEPAKPQATADSVASNSAPVDTRSGSKPVPPVSEPEEKRAMVTAPSPLVANASPTTQAPTTQEESAEKTANGGREAPQAKTIAAVDSPSPAETVTPVSDEPEIAAVLPDEPTSAGIETGEAVASEPAVLDNPAVAESQNADGATDTGRGFFGTLFDVLFGWLG